MNWDILNNREWALFSWITGVVVILLFTKYFRQFLIDIFKILFLSSLAWVLIGMLGYIFLIVFEMFKVGFWNTGMLKDTIMWTITVGFVIFGNSISKASKQDLYFRDVIIENIKLTVLVEFIINLYVFPFWIEFLLVPIMAIIVGVIAVADSKPKYYLVLKFLNTLLAIFGFVCIVYAIYHIIAGFADFATLQNLEGLLLPILLTFTFLPYAYMLAVYSTYQVLLIRVKGAYRHKPLMAKYARWQILKAAHFNLSKVRQLSKNLQVFMIDTKKELKEALNNEFPKLIK